jgi:hypothetical protein
MGISVEAGNTCYDSSCNYPYAYVSASFPQTTCSAGSNPVYDYAIQTDTDTTQAYGVGTYSTPNTWTFNTMASQGHMILDAVLWYWTLGQYWSQSGYVIGGLDTGTANNRVPYMEVRVQGNDPQYAIWNSYTIPDNDQGKIQDWTYSQDAGGNYIAHGLVYSPYWNLNFLTTANLGPNEKFGKVYLGLETEYYIYTGACDKYAQYSTTNGAVYTTSMSTSEPLSVGTSWSGCTTRHDSPYHTTGCASTIQYWGP